MKISSVVLCGLLFVLTACTWVKSTPEGRQVKVLTADAVGNCERLGTTTSKALSKVGFVNRNQGKLSVELELLARNEAAVMGGNAVVVDSEIEEGRQRFAVYKCPSL